VVCRASGPESRTSDLGAGNTGCVVVCLAVMEVVVTGGT
jgi:hypothetical protein